MKRFTKVEENSLVEWTPASMLEIILNEPDDFLKVKETLTRIGVASKRENKQGRYFIVHFKELFLLDGKKANLELLDLQRRNSITTLMSDWGLLKIVSKEQLDCAPLRMIKIVSFKDKGEWELCPKYNIGKK